MMNDSRSVLITGASSGIGHATALEMKRRNWRVFATARKPEDLEALRAAGLETIPLDLADPDSIADAARQVLKLTDGTLYGLVNNAGFGQPGALEDLTRDAMRAQFDVNVIGLQELTNLLLPSMIRNGQGRVVHVSSVVGRVALPFMGVYSASKFAVEALADAQRVELRGTGVHLSLLEPGPITTRFSVNAEKTTHDGMRVEGSRFQALYEKEREARKAKRDPRPFSLPPEAAAIKIARALTAKRPARRYKVTLPAYLGACLSRIAPDALLDAILSRQLPS